MMSFLTTCSLSVAWLGWLQGVSQRLVFDSFCPNRAAASQSYSDHPRGIILGLRCRLRAQGLLQQQTADGRFVHPVSMHEQLDDRFGQELI
jgi:hypothetical protein